MGPRACYDEGKRCAETLFWDFKNQHSLRVKICRIFNTYGPHMLADDGRVISNFIAQALNNEEITIFGDGSQTRSFCYVSDMVDGMIKFMEAPDEFWGPLNLGNTQEISIKEIAELIIELTQSRSKINYHPFREDDPMQRKPDITLAQEILNWNCAVELRDGLLQTIDYFRENYGP